MRLYNPAIVTVNDSLFLAGGAMVEVPKGLSSTELREIKRVWARIPFSQGT